MVAVVVAVAVDHQPRGLPTRGESARGGPGTLPAKQAADGQVVVLRVFLELPSRKIDPLTLELLPLLPVPPPESYRYNIVPTR